MIWLIKSLAIVYFFIARLDFEKVYYTGISELYELQAYISQYSNYSFFYREEGNDSKNYESGNFKFSLQIFDLMKNKATYSMKRLA